MKAKMELAESKQAYSKRKETSELTYAHIKYNLGFTEFLTRGLKRDGNTEFSKKFFVYNETSDTFTCPTGKTLPYKSHTVDKRGNIRKNYFSCKACWSCPSRPQCAANREMRIITATPYEGVVRRMKAKMELAESKQVYSKRKETSELTYAHIKYNLGFTEFLTRGIQGVKAEWNLACAASNLRRIWSQIQKKGMSIKQVFNQIAQSFWQIFIPA